MSQRPLRTSRIVRPLLANAWALAFVASLAIGFARPSYAEYPDHPIRIVVPLAPGGAVDTVARLIQPYIEKALGQPIVIDNRPGASGMIGADAVTKAPADGYTLLLVPSTFSVNPAVQKKMAFDVERDFQPVAVIGENSLLILVHPSVPAKNLKEFIALAKAEPGKFNYATPGATSQAHLLISMLSNRAGIKMQQIPFKGGAPAVMATVAGQTHLTMMSPLISAVHIEAGKLRPIAAGGQKREDKFPDVPTIVESGFPGLLATQWIGLLVKAGTPADIVKRLNTAVNDALRQPEVKDKLAAQGVSTVGGTPDEFKVLIAQDVKDWKEAAKIADIK